MAATTYSNVINLQPGGSGVTVAANRILLECRDMAARQLREALREIFKLAGENLRQRGDVAKEMDERRFLYALNDKLNSQAVQFEGKLAAYWGQKFDAALKGPKVPGSGELLLEEMQIVDYSEMDESLAQKAVSRRLQDRCDEELYALGRRFGYLIGKESNTDSNNPMAPDVVINALHDALRDTDFDTQSRQELYRFLEGCIETHVGPIYHAINLHLMQRGILPNLRRDYGRAVASQPPQKNNVKKEVAGDMFSVLQGLISGNAAGAPASAPHGTASPLAVFSGQAGMAVPAHVMSSLDAMQFAAPASPASQPTAPDMANVLHQFRSSEVGQGLGQLDAITVDIVAMLFDMIFDDRDISDPIKALVGKLQIPVLKVAMLDRSFFSSKAHPTRRLLDLISRAALRWSCQVGHEDPVYRKIAAVVDHVHDNFKQDTALFEVLCGELERFLAEHEDADAGNISRAAVLVVQRELEELADMAVESELHLWLGNQLPGPVTNLLDHEWRALLRQIHLKEGPDSNVWKDALTTAANLVDSVQPKHDGHERQALARQLPLLIKQLSAGFDRIKVDGDRRHALLDALFSLHAASLRGTEPVPAQEQPVAEEPPLPDSEPDIASQSLGDGEITVESISVTMPHFPAVASQDVDALKRGDWVEYIQADGSAIRYRLSWISPQRGIFLFTNPQSPNALAVSPEAMSLQVQRGEVRILSTEPIFDRALTRTIDILQAA